MTKMNLKRLVAALLITGPLAGCVGVLHESERAARRDQQALAELYRPENKRPALPDLSTNSDLGDFLRYAMLNQPKVEAAYYDWMAAVERITTARSLPDPRFTFEADISDMVLSLVPGLMMDLPGPGKLRLRAEAASAESRGKYFTFEGSVLQIAFDLKKAFYQLYFLDEKLRVNRQTLELLDGLENIARAQNEVGKVTLQDVLRAQIEQERLRTELVNLEDSRNSLLAQFKAALGLTPEQPNPTVPAKFESTLLDMSAEELLATALARNPQLKAMEAEVRRAEAELRLAYKERVPDFTVGVEVDVKPATPIFTPQFAVTLPIWRDKIAAGIAAAQANKRATEARLSSEQIMLAVELAEKTFMYREASRNVGLFQERLLPRARQSLDVARAAYLSGQLDFLNVIDAQRTLLGIQLDEVQARTQRELALAELSLVIAGFPPTGAPVLTTSGQTTQ